MRCPGSLRLHTYNIEWRVTHADGGRTFAEGQEPVTKEVRAAAAHNGLKYYRDSGQDKVSALRLLRLVQGGRKPPGL